MNTLPTVHVTTVTFSRANDGMGLHTAHCTCGWETTSNRKPDVEWRARLHRATHLKEPK